MACCDRCAHRAIRLNALCPALINIPSKFSVFYNCHSSWLQLIASNESLKKIAVSAGAQQWSSQRSWMHSANILSAKCLQCALCEQQKFSRTPADTMIKWLKSVEENHKLHSKNYVLSRWRCCRWRKIIKNRVDRSPYVHSIRFAGAASGKMHKDSTWLECPTNVSMESKKLPCICQRRISGKHWAEN